MDLEFQSESSRSVDIMNTDDKLNCAAREGNIESLYKLIQEDPHVLEHFEAIPFVETPLHVAASAGHLQFAIEIMRLKPSFALKPNQQGLCPIHLALQCHQKRMVHRFVDINKDLVRAQGKAGFTPLHLLVSQDSQFDPSSFELLHKFLEACPDSVKDVNVRSENALHIAVHKRQLEVLRVLVTWLKKNTDTGAADLEKTVLNWKDDAGNTVLHISTLMDNSEAIRLFVESKVDLNAKNLDNETALDITRSEEIKKILSRAGAKTSSSNNTNAPAEEIKPKFLEKWLILKTRTRKDTSEDRINAYLVVATLVATVTYQTALSPPGGFYQAEADTSNNTLNHFAFNYSVKSISNTRLAGNTVMSSLFFILFSSTNMFSFLTSTFVIFGLLPRGTVRSLLFVPTFLLQFSYILSVMLISPTVPTAAIIGFCFMVLELVFLYYVYLIDFPNKSQ